MAVTILWLEMVKVRDLVAISQVNPFTYFSLHYFGIKIVNDIRFERVEVDLGHGFCGMA
jgi:hypothetical protein